MAVSLTTPDEYRRSVAHWVWVTLFFASCLATFRVAQGMADQVVLRWAYGRETVEREQLRIVSHKPVLQISNGDRLEQWTFRHFLVTSAIWLPLCAGVLVVLRSLLPRDYRGMAESLSPDKIPAGLFSALLIPTLILLIFLSWSAVACGLAALVAIAMAWMTAGRPAPPSDSVLDRH
jgi:hypothetical protein